MTVTIAPPAERTCERCGRTETWVDDVEGWQIADDPGNVYCIHDWDINGSYVPIQK